MPTKDIEKRNAQAKARYWNDPKVKAKAIASARRYRENNPGRSVAAVKDWKRRNPDSVQEQRRRAAEREGRTYKGSRHDVYVRSQERIKDRLQTTNAQQAWRYWLKEKAPGPHHPSVSIRCVRR